MTALFHEIYVFVHSVGFFKQNIKCTVRMFWRKLFPPSLEQNGDIILR